MLQGYKFTPQNISSFKDLAPSHISGPRSSIRVWWPLRCISNIFSSWSRDSTSWMRLFKGGRLSYFHFIRISPWVLRLQKAIAACYVFVVCNSEISNLIIKNIKTEVDKLPNSITFCFFHIIGLLHVMCILCLCWDAASQGTVLNKLIKSGQ